MFHDDTKCNAAITLVGNVPLMQNQQARVLQKEPFYLCLLKKSHWVRFL